MNTKAARAVPPLNIKTYTSTNASLATVIDKQTLEQVYRDLDNAPMGTASLSKVLQEIASERNA